MTDAPHRLAPDRVTPEAFDALFESVKNWGVWGPDDQLGTLNYITPQTVRSAAKLVRTGRRVSMALPINKTAGPDNPDPALHFVSQGHDIDIDSGGVRFGMDFLGMTCHGDAHSHVDALSHISYNGLAYNGRPAQEVLTTQGSAALDITNYRHGLVGRGVLIDVPHHRGVPWLEPGDAVRRREIEVIEEAQGVRLGEGDILVFRTGHNQRRLTRGPWNNGAPPQGEGKAGLHVDTVPWMHDRRIAAFLPDGDGEAIPSSVESIQYPIHPLQIVAMGMLAADSLDLEELAMACQQEKRWEFLVVGLPLRLPGGTGSPWNPLAIF